MLFFHSAGVGRTGTLIGIDMALSQASKEKQVDISKIIVNMRRQRMKMVQTVVRKKLDQELIQWVCVVCEGGGGGLLAQNCASARASRSYQTVDLII